jgi:hypothetical protein
MKKNKTFEPLLNHYITPNIMITTTKELLVQYMSYDYSKGTPTQQISIQITFPPSRKYTETFVQQFKEAQNANRVLQSQGLK